MIPTPRKPACGEQHHLSQPSCNHRLTVTCMLPTDHKGAHRGTVTAWQGETHAWSADAHR
jgi:hypothetical protein